MKYNIAIQPAVYEVNTFILHNGGSCVIKIQQSILYVFTPWLIILNKQGETAKNIQQEALAWRSSEINI